MNKQILAAGVLAALALGTVGGARSQENLPAGMPYALTAEGVTAQGHSEIKEKPDVARMTFSVTTNARHSSDAVQQNAERTTAVMTSLQSVGVAAKDIQTQSYTVQPTFDYSESPPKRKGYQVENSFEVTVRDLTKVGLVLDSATGDGVSEIGSMSFDLSDRAGAEAQALSQAVASAKLKASVIAWAAGVDLGRLLSVTEGATAPPIRPVPLFAPRSLAAYGTPTSVTPIADQQITVTADATLVYAMGGV